LNGWEGDWQLRLTCHRDSLSTVFAHDEYGSLLHLAGCNNECRRLSLIDNKSRKQQ
uniref:Uncharacterized protein n=1 Tax=Cairina moschata TaxID=8855 RepID=A0A8C3GEZ2_CAIMO